MKTNATQQYDTELQWKNWLKYLNDTADAIEELRQSGEAAYFDSRYLNTFFAKLDTFISTRAAYIDPRIGEKLDKIGKTLFSKEYLRDLSKNIPAAKQKQYQLRRELDNILRNVIVNLSQNEILPKLNKKVKYDPNKAILNTNY